MNIPDNVDDARRAMGLPDIEEATADAAFVPAEPTPPQFGRGLIKFGMFVAAVCPIISVIGMAIWQMMPLCIGGSSGPASGCVLLGLNLNWAMQLVTAALVGNFLAVPLGLVIIALGAIVRAFEGRGKRK